MSGFAGAVLHPPVEGDGDDKAEHLCVVNRHTVDMELDVEALGVGVGHVGVADLLPGTVEVVYQAAALAEFGGKGWGSHCIG